MGSDTTAIKDDLKLPVHHKTCKSHMNYTDAFVLIDMWTLQTIAIFLDTLILFWLHRYNAVNEIIEEWKKHMLYQSIQTEKCNLMFCINHSNLYFVSNFFHLKTITSVISEEYNWIVSLHPKENVRSAVKHLTYHDDNVLWLSRSSGYLILKIAGSLKKIYF